MLGNFSYARMRILLPIRTRKAGSNWYGGQGVLSCDPYSYPTVDSKKGSEAFVGCWANDPIRNIAFDKATKRIRGQGWNVIEIIEDYPISRDDYLLKPEGLEYYDQAIIDGEVFVFFIPKHESGTKSAHT